MNDIPIPIPNNPVKLLDQVRALIRTLNLAYKTEQTYLLWIKRFILFHNKRHPKEMGAVEIKAFLDYLALDRNVTINTQRTALNALVFLYKRFFEVEVGDIGMVNAQRKRRIPVVFSHREAMAVINSLEGHISLLPSCFMAVACASVRLSAYVFWMWILRCQSLWCVAARATRIAVLCYQKA